MAESSLLRLLPSRATPRCPARRPLLPKPCRSPAPAHPPPPPGDHPRLCHVRATPVKAHAVIAEKDGSMWWEKNVGQNMIDVDSPEAFLDVLNQSGDRLVIVEFYNTWCASCRGLFPKLCKIAEEHPEITFVKVKFDENKPMCKRLNVRVLPYFHFYHGSEGLVEFFSCSLVQFQKIKDAIALHNTPRHVSGPPLGVGDLDLFNGPYPTTPRASSR